MNWSSIGPVARNRARLARRTSRDLLAAAVRRSRARLDPTAVPEPAWPVPDTGGSGTGLPEALDTDAFAPRPPSPRLRRWLPVDPAASLVGLRVVAPGPTQARDDREAFTVEQARALVEAWPGAADAAGAPAAVPVLVCDPAALPVLRRCVRARALVLPVPGPARRAVLLNALAAVVVPAPVPPGGTPPAPTGAPPPARGSDWALEARASGVPVLTLGTDLDDVRGLPAWLADAERLGERGRRGRLAVVRARPARRGPAGVAPGPAAGGQHPDRVSVGAEPRRVVVAGHDLKFARGLVEYLAGLGHDVRLDEWTGHQRHDPARSRQLARWADAVLCEWTLGNAVWYAEHAPRHTRLTTRLHRQEVTLDYPGLVRRGRMDRFIFVADHVRRQAIRDHRLDPALTTVVPNAVHVPPEPPVPAAGPGPAHAPDRAFTLGLVGITPALKGLHRALDLVALLRDGEPRYTLRIKGHLPSDQAWMAARTHEASYYREQFARMEADPLLAGAVHLDDFGDDMAEWYSGIGVALSTSDLESFHLTLADGAARGAVPVSLAWAGSDGLYPLDWLHASVADMAGTIRRLGAAPAAHAEAAGRARAWVREHFDAGRVLPMLAREVLGG